MSEFHVQKRQISASLYLVNSSVLRGTVFASEFSQRIGHAQTVGDLVSQQEAMLPLRDQVGRFVLVGRHGIVAAEVPIREAEMTGLVVEVPVALETTGGHRFNGTFLIDEGAGERVSDVLNSTQTWLQLRTPTAHIWIARHHILTARPEGD